MVVNAGVWLLFKDEVKVRRLLNIANEDCLVVYEQITHFKPVINSTSHTSKAAAPICRFLLK